MAVALVGTVSHNEDGSGGTATTIAVTRNGIVAGNLVVVMVTCDDVQTITNVSDGTTTISTADVALDWTAGTQRMAFYSFPNHPGGNKTFTATFSSAVDYRGIEVVELSGADTVAPFAGSASATGNSTTPATGNVSPTPSADGCYILAVAFGSGGQTPTPSGSYTELLHETVLQDSLSGLAQATAAATGATWTIGTAATWGAIAAVYKPRTVNAVLSGTALSSITEADIVAGGKTIIITLTGDRWIAI